MYNRNRQNEQIYGRNDMVMLDGHNKIYGSLGMAEQYVFNTVEGNPAILPYPKAGKLKDVATEFEMQGWTEQDSTTGAQLFDKTKIEDRVDTTHTETDTGVEVSGLYYVIHRVSVAPNTDMYISYNKSGKGLNQVSVYGTDISADNFISSSYGEGMKFNTGNHTEILVLFYSSTGTENVSIYNDVMLNLGATALPYEPYTGGQPSPNPDYPQEIVSAGKYNEDTQKWEYEVKLTGKNLLPYGEGILEVGEPYEQNGRTYVLNEDGLITITTQDSSVPTGSVFIFGTQNDRKHYKLPAGEYTVSTFNGNIPNMSIQLEDKNGANTRAVGAGKFELKEHEYIAYAWLYGAVGTEWNGTIYPQLEYGDVSTPYEPYHTPQTVTLTADRPLTKWDKLEKRNGQWGWVYKSGVKQLISDMFILKNTEGTYQVPNFVEADINRRTEALSTHFIYKLLTKEYGVFWLDSAGTGLRFRMSQFQTVEEVKDWLQENEVYFTFPNATETFVPLSASEQEQMNALYTFRPTTVLSNDCDCNMRVTYKVTQVTA